jgi:peptidoglycan/LPS O-acetylase OafA/YrhL
MFGYLRFFLAILVLLSHLKITCGINQGITAVVSFYMLAGFVVTHLLTKVFQPGPTIIKRFFLERFLRIFPLYLYVLALTLVFLILTGFGQPYFSPVRLLANLLVIPLNYYMVWDNSILQDPKFWLVPPAWSLAAELQAYILLPLVIFSKRLKVLLAGSSFLIFMLAVTAALEPDYFGYRLIPGVFFMFIIGTCLYKSTRIPEQADTFDRIFPPFCYLVAIFCLPVMGFLGSVKRGVVLEVFLGLLLGIPIIHYLSRNPLRLPLDRLLGDLSYGIFISHFLSMWILIYLFHLQASSLGGATAIFLFAVVISFVGTFILERSLFKYRSGLSVEEKI